MNEFSQFQSLAAGIASLATVIGLVVGAWWAYWKFIIQGEKLAHIESSAEIEFIGFQDDSWVAELRAVLTNKGKVEHRIAKFSFDLSALAKADKVTTSAKWGGQVDFPNPIAQGSFLPSTFRFFVVGPGVTARYSFLTRIPKKMSMVMLHCRFEYMDRPGFGHSMETTMAVPPVSAGTNPASGIS